MMNLKQQGIFSTSLRVAIGPLALAIVFVLTVAAVPAAQAQTFNVIHYFTGGPDGSNPWAGLTIDRGGSLYGGTSLGGNSSDYCAPTCGVVFKMTHSGSGWVLAPLYSFHGTDGASPDSRLIFGPDGTLYGTAGLVFNLKPLATACKTALCPWTETVVYQFCCGLNSPGGLTFDKAGNLYGASPDGGTINKCSGGGGCGYVFQLVPLLGGWTENDLYHFSGGGDGAHPMGGVIFDQAGNLYGTTGGLYQGDGNGTVFELTPSGAGFWTETTLYRFQAGSDGKFPEAGLIFDQSGNLYGATTTGGSGNGGTVFQLTPSNRTWDFNLLYSLSGSNSYLGGPRRNLTMDAAGNLYGTTYSDGAYGAGSVFKLTPSDGGWTYTSLHDFTGGSDGANPEASLTFDNKGNLYGTTFAGGQTGANCANYINYQCGVVFEITP